MAALHMTVAKFVLGRTGSGRI